MIRYILFLLFIVLCFWGCEEEQSKDCAGIVGGKTECCHKYVRRSIKVNKGSLSKEDVIMALLFDLLNDAVGEFCDAEFDNETLPFIEKFIGMVTFIEVLRTHYLMDLNKILKGIDSAIVFCTPIRKEMIH